MSLHIIQCPRCNDHIRFDTSSLSEESGQLIQEGDYVIDCPSCHSKYALLMKNHNLVINRSVSLRDLKFSVRLSAFFGVIFSTGSLFCLSLFFDSGNSYVYKIVFMLMTMVSILLAVSFFYSMIKKMRNIKNSKPT